MAGILISLGVDKHLSAVITLLMRFCTLWFAVLLGVLAILLLAKWKLKKIKPDLIKVITSGVAEK